MVGEDGRGCVSSSLKDGGVVSFEYRVAGVDGPLLSRGRPGKDGEIWGEGGIGQQSVNGKRVKRFRRFFVGSSEMFDKVPAD
jgi:hypothetical protein